MADKEVIAQGYRLIKKIYDYEAGILTAFYVQEETDRLYISQVRWQPPVSGDISFTGGEFKIQ